MNFFDKTGKMALGSRLRLLTAKITEEALLIYEMYGLEMTPKWFPVFFILSENEEKTITEIAKAIGHSQPSVTKIVKEMNKAGLVLSNLASNDKRRNVVGLTDKGKVLSKKIQITYQDVEKAIEKLQSEATHNLWNAIAEWESLLEEKTLFKRVQEEKKLREIKDVQIVEYQPNYKTAFRNLNIEWISQYFEMEENDYKTLDNPEKYILNKGGKILVALYKNEPVGVCSLIKMNDPEYDFEIAKMAVSPKAQGKSVGYLLGLEIIKTAKELGAKKLFLDSNTRLKAAINLYYKLGFQKTSGHPSPYKRVNIQMELTIK